MKNLVFNSKSLLAGFCLLLATAACKKNNMEATPQGDINSSTQGTANGNLGAEKAFVVMDKQMYGRASSDFTNSLYVVAGLKTKPYKKLLFAGEPKQFIGGICADKEVNNAYFLYNGKVKDKSGVWKVSLDGSKSTQLVKKFQEGMSGYCIDVDVTNNKIYWAEGKDASHMTLWSSTLKGNGRKQVEIKGVAEIGKFAVDGDHNRIYFQYTKEGNAVIGACDLSGTIINEVVAKVGGNTISKPIYLDLKYNRIFMKSGSYLRYVPLYSNAANFQNYTSGVLTNYSCTAYDFSKLQGLYYTKLDNPSKLFCSYFTTENEKVIMDGFSEVGGIHNALLPLSEAGN